jgi:hypothetical protein
MTLTVIGLTGAAGSGKTTVAGHMVENWYTERRAFADSLKRMLRRFLEDQGVGLAEACRMTSGDLKEVPTEYLGGRSPREAMQTLGTEWGRTLSPSLWIDAWRRSVEKLALETSADEEDLIVVVDDVRFPNEVEAIRSLGGIIVRIERPGAGLDGARGAHASETADLGEPDHAIENDGSLRKLGWTVDALMADVTR